MISKLRANCEKPEIYRVSSDTVTELLRDGSIRHRWEPRHAGRATEAGARLVRPSFALGIGVRVHVAEVRIQVFGVAAGEESDLPSRRSHEKRRARQATNSLWMVAMSM
jgi:hypothetical protein